MGVRCSYSVVRETEHTVYLVDNDNGGVSMTNDAENVCRMYPNKRVMYRDTLGIWDQMVHVGGRFIRFTIGTGPEDEGAY